MEQSLIDDALTNGKHACMLVFVPMAHILNIPSDNQFVFSVNLYLMNFVLHITLDAENHRLRVHYNCEM